MITDFNSETHKLCVIFDLPLIHGLSGYRIYFIAELLPQGEVLGIDALWGMINTAALKAKHNLRFLLLDLDDLDLSCCSEDDRGNPSA